MSSSLRLRTPAILALTVVCLFMVSALGQASASGVLQSAGGSNLTWARSYSGGGGINIIFSVQQTKDGGYVAAGAEDGNLWVLRLNPTGHILWQKEYGGSDVTSVRETQEGGFIVSSGGRVLKLDSQGNILWQKFYSTGRTESIYSIEQTSDGGFLAAGFTATTTPLAHGWILRLDMSGNILWQKIFQGDNVDYFTSAQQ